MTSCNMFYDSPGGQCCWRDREPSDPWLLFGVIEGDVDTPFRIVTMENGPRYDRVNPHDYFKEAVHEAPKFPLWAAYRSPPYAFPGNPPNLESVGTQSTFLLQHTCEALEARRLALLARLDSIRDLQNIRDSLLTAKERMKALAA